MIPCAWIMKCVDLVCMLCVRSAFISSVTVVELSLDGMLVYHGGRGRGRGRGRTYTYIHSRTTKDWLGYYKLMLLDDVIPV